MKKAGETGLTKSGQMLGTPDYVAPEQTLDAHKADIRADIYSLGCTLYFLLSGRTPFEEPSLYAILEAHHKREPKPLNLARPEVPVELATVVAKMMAKKPAKRYQTPLEVAKSLVPFFKPGQSVAPPPSVGWALPTTPTETLQARVGAGADVGPSVGDAYPINAMVGNAHPTPSVMPVAIAPSRPPAEDFSVSIDTHRAKRRRSGWSSLPPWQRWAALGGAAAALLLGILLLVRTPRGTIEIELSDPDAKVTVTVDGNKVDIAGLGEPLSLELGEHDFKVTGKGYETITDKFTVTKGSNAPLKITLLRREPKGDASKRFPCEIRDRLQAKWSIDGDELIQSSLDGDRNDIIFGEADWGDIDFSVEVKRTSGNDLCALWWRYQNDNNADIYLVGGNENTYYIARSLDDMKASDLASRKGSISTGKWHRLEVRVRGRHGECFLDRGQILSFETDRRGRGRVGLRTWGAAYRFRNIVVKDADGKVLLDGLPDLNRGRVNVATDLQGKRPAVQPFVVPLNGLAGQESMRPICFGPDWLGFNELLPTDPYLAQGFFARPETRGALGYPTIPVSRYVVETELEILRPAAGAGMRLCLGDPHCASHISVFWDKDRNKSNLVHQIWRYGSWNWTGGRDFDVGDRLPLKLIVLDGRQVLCLRNKPILSLEDAWPADLTLRVCSEASGGVLIHRCSCRELRKEDVEEIHSPMPEAELRLDVAAAQTRIESLRKDLPILHADGKPFMAGSIRSPMTWIAPGEYGRGCQDRKPPQRHRVKITQGFWIGRLEVTQEEWNALMPSNPSRIKGSPYLPVDWVTWQDAMAFCEKLNQMEKEAGRLPKGYVYRLPTDAEWEYACRAGSEEDFSVPLHEVLSREHSGRCAHEVGEKSANAWGLFDMHGNAMEWCLDGWHEYPKDTATVLVDPYHAGEVKQGTFVVRGGAWWTGEDACRSCWREQNHSSPAGGFRGFRIVLGPALKQAAK